MLLIENLLSFPLTTTRPDCLNVLTCRIDHASPAKENRNPLPPSQVKWSALICQVSVFLPKFCLPPQTVECKSENKRFPPSHYCSPPTLRGCQFAIITLKQNNRQRGINEIYLPVLHLSHCAGKRGAEGGNEGF